MKIAIVGAGKVGSACALAAVIRGSARNIVIIDRTRKRAKAVATDLLYGSPLCPKTEVVDGDYDDLTDAALVMIAAGINEKAGGATDRNDPRVDCGFWIPMPKSIARSFRVSSTRPPRQSC
jgi:L-lactate dehydrogenase